ncbi:MAG TPA: hypothetical protein VGE10_05840 [Zeimonas sp.]
MKAGDDSDVELLHLVARAAEGARPLRSRAACADLWSRLGSRFDVVACVLMPDHVHLLARVDSAVALRAFARVLSSFRARIFASREQDRSVFEWERLPHPQKVQRDPRHVARTIRYIHLNPCRDRLCDDPLEWEWSTHRDWTEAIVRPCVDLARWGRFLRRPAATRAEWLHEYVCADASVQRPRPLADPRRWLGAERVDVSLATLSSAVPRVLRSKADLPVELDVEGRRLFVLAAGRWTLYRAAEIARWIGRDATGVRRLLKAEEVAANENRASGASDGERRARWLAAPRSPGAVRSASSNDTRGNLDADDLVPPRRPRPLASNELRALALTLADPRLRS